MEKHILGISAAICTYNEEKRLPILLESLKGVDEIVISDDGSTDKTIEIAKSFGADIYRRPDFSERPTKKEVKAFTKRFGWDPTFTTENKLINGAKNRNEILEHVHNDWVISPDADEVVTWDLPEVKKLLPNADQIKCKFVHSHKPDGTPEAMLSIIKLFRKSKAIIQGRTHDVLLPTGREVYTDKMQVDHYQQPRDRGYVRPILEYAVLKDNDPRSLFYLGREYFYYREYERAVQILKEYLKVAGWQPEICEAYKFMAGSCWQIGRGNESREYALEVVRQNPADKEALLMMAEYYNSPSGIQEKWKRLAEAANNENVLFVKAQ